MYRSILSKIRRQPQNIFPWAALAVTCPICNCNKVQSKPVADDKIHKFDYDFRLDSPEISLIHV